MQIIRTVNQYITIDDDILNEFINNSDYGDSKEDFFDFLMDTDPFWTMQVNDEETDSLELWDTSEVEFNNLIDKLKKND